MTANIGEVAHARPALPEHALAFGRVAALSTVFLISSRYFLGQGVSLGHVATLVFSPLWLPALRRYTGGRWLAWSGLAATIASVWLTVLASADHDTTASNLVGNTLLMTGSIAAIGVLLWARELLPAWLIGAVYAVGLLVAVVVHQDTIGFNRGSGGEVNPWKFAFGVPIGILVLSLARRARRRSVEIAALAALALVSAAFDSRSYFGEFIVAALLVAWQMLPGTGRRTSAVRVVLTFGVVIVGVYNLGTQLVVNGALGAATQARSIEQIDRAGSIIVGGRPEMGATVALFLSRPLGFGGGTVATSGDVAVAKAGMKQVNYEPNNGYVENFLFGTKFELHSMTGDLWAYAGLAGIAVAGIALVLLIVVVGQGVSGRTISGLVLFCVVQSFWNLFFNPLYSSAPVLVIGLGLGLGLARARPVAGIGGASPMSETLENKQSR